MRDLVAEHPEWHSALQAYQDNGTELNATGRDLWFVIGRAIQGYFSG